MLNTNEIYNMDCMEGLKLLDDKSIDLVVIDPPYLLNLTKRLLDMKKDYYNIPKINVYAIFNDSKNVWALNVLKKLGIQLENKLYTEYEFECLRVDVAEYYENEEELPVGVTKKEYKKLREILDNIYY